MLRPAVAATNCAKALETAGLDIADRAPVDGKTTDTAMHGMTGPQSARPGEGRQRRPETSAIAGTGQGWEFETRERRPGCTAQISPGQCPASPPMRGSGIPETPENKSRGRGILDRPVKPDDDSSLKLVGRKSENVFRQFTGPVGAICGVYHRARIRATRWLLRPTVCWLGNAPNPAPMSADKDFAS